MMTHQARAPNKGPAGKRDCIILHYPIRMMNATWACIKCAFQCFPAKSCSSVSDCSARNKARLQLHHARDERSHWWDIHSPRGPLPPAAPQNITARIGYPLHAPAAQRSWQKDPGKGRNPRVPKYFGAQGRGKRASNVIPTASSFYPMLFICSSVFYIPFLTRLCSLPSQQIPNFQPFPPVQAQAATSQMPNFCSHSTMKNLTKTAFSFLTMDSTTWEFKSHLGSALIR